MARKRSVREDAEASRPRQLRKRLRKAEDQLADAQQKRDRAQARVEALSIIADEIRAQLAEADKAAEADADAGQTGIGGQRRRSGRRPRQGEGSQPGRSAAAEKPAADASLPPTRKPAAARKPGQGAPHRLAREPTARGVGPLSRSG